MILAVIGQKMVKGAQFKWMGSLAGNWGVCDEFGVNIQMGQWGWGGDELVMLLRVQHLLHGLEVIHDW